MMSEVQPTHIQPPNMAGMTDLAYVRICRVLIVQPSVPEYRLPLFERLSREPGFSLQVVASEDDLTARELKGGQRSTKFDYVSYDSRTFLGGRLVWQSGLHLDKWLRKGDVLV